MVTKLFSERALTDRRDQLDIGVLKLKDGVRGAVVRVAAAKRNSPPRQNLIVACHRIQIVYGNQYMVNSVQWH